MREGSRVSGWALGSHALPDAGWFDCRRPPSYENCVRRNFMSPRNWLILLIVLAALGEGWLAWREHLDNIALRGELLRVQSDTRLTKQVAELQKQNQALRQEAQDVGRQREQFLAAPPAPVPGPVRIGGLDAAGNPSFIQLSSAQINAIVQHRYGAYLARLSLPPEQLARVAELLANRQQAAIDAVNAAFQQGLTPQGNLGEIKQAIAQAQSESGTQLETQLGSSGYAQLQQFEQSAPQRNAVASLQQALSATADLLTEDQAAALIPAIAQTQAPDDGGGIGRALFGSMDYHARLTAQTVAAATGILSPSQVQVMQQLLQKQQPAQLQQWETQPVPIPAAK